MKPSETHGLYRLVRLYASVHDPIDAIWMPTSPGTPDVIEYNGTYFAWTEPWKRYIRCWFYHVPADCKLEQENG
jgi:hypothetical protein